MWGVTTFYYDRFVSTDELIEDINHIANEKGYVDMGDIMISLVSMPMQGKGMVNTLRVSEIDSCAVNFDKKEEDNSIRITKKLSINRTAFLL